MGFTVTFIEMHTLSLFDCIHKLFMTFYLLVFSFMTHAFGIVPKRPSSNPGSLRFLYVIYKMFYSFAFYIYVYVPF
jgi:hypothetical protein